jgi:hypothetical protein
MTLISKTHLKTVETTAVINSRAVGTFISKNFIKLHKIHTHCLSKPFKVMTADGSLSKSGPITHDCILTVKIDDCTMIGKFNVTRLRRHDQILLGIPWLHALDPIIRWKAGTLSLPRTLKSNLIEEDVNNERKRNGLPLAFLKKPKYKHLRLPKEPVKPEYVDSTVPMQVEPVKPECIDSTAPFSTKIKEIPNEDMHIPSETSSIFDTKEDIWGNYKPPVADVSTYYLHNKDVLIEYHPDGTEMRIIENLSLDTPLTCDGTSKAEQKQPPSMKFSNKAQQFMVAGAHSKIEQKKKSFDEMKPGFIP